MRKRQHTKLIHEGEYVAEVEVELIDSDEVGHRICPLMMPADWMKYENHYRKGDLKKQLNVPDFYSHTCCSLSRQFLF